MNALLYFVLKIAAFPSFSDAIRDWRNNSKSLNHNFQGLYQRECKEENGCFPLTSDFYHPLYRPVNLAPWSRGMIDTRFTLFSRDSAEGVNLDLSRTGHDWSDRPLKILIPGWLDNLVIAKWMVDLKDALLFNENSRVIAVEWNNFTPYIIAASNSRVVGFEVANLLNYLSANGVRLENVHLIGHSLGAHISGYAGAMVRGVGRITALDPARPYFEHMPPSVRLDVSDALQVDAIHSDTGKVFPIGFLGHLGHVDFYPNQDAQPACLKDSFMRGMMESFNFKLITGLMEGVRYSLTCAHQKSLEYYQESLINDKCRFIGVRCPSYEKVLRGECTCDDSDFTCMEISRTSMDSTSLARLEHEPGKWFVHTNPEAPYCMFQYQVVMQLGLNKDIEHLPASLHIQLLRSGSQHPVRAKLTSSDRTLRSDQRMSYFVVSRSELWSNIPPTVSVYWTVDDRSKVKSNSSHELVVRYIKMSPIALRTGNQLTRFYCGSNGYLRLKSFTSVTLLPKMIC